MKVTLVSTFGIVCGVAEYAAYWKEAVEREGVKVEVVTDLHPNAILSREKLPTVTVLNYHAALLSQWHPEHIREVQKRGGKVVTIWHDSGVPNSDHCKAICEASDHFVLHEPYDDLPANGTYLRQGVPDWEDPIRFMFCQAQAVKDGTWWGEQPVVGTVGLSLGYRNLDLLCEAADLTGWAVLLIVPKATDEDVNRWVAINPATVVIREFIPRDQVVSYLAGCAATAFLVVSNNAGTSGAIRQGIAARKPVLALPSRQFRDLLAPHPEGGICWIDEGTPHGVAVWLEEVVGEGINGSMVRLAHQDSWRQRGKDFAQILRQLTA